MAKQSTFKIWGGVESFDPKKGAVEVLSYYLMASGITGVVLGAAIGSLIAAVGVPDNVSALIGVAIFAAALLVGFSLYLQSGGDETEMLDLVELDNSSAPRLTSLVEGITASIGIDMPPVYLLEEPQINATCIVAPGRLGAVVVTSGALELLTRLELEAVLARELVRLRSGEVVFEARLRSFRRTMASISPRFVPVVYTREMLGRDIAADVAAMTVTRFPPALLSALQKADAIRVPPSKDRDRCLFAQFWFIPELRDVSTDERIIEISEF